MDIEELAFKDRTQLAHLNELDLLDIIEFLQLDRKLWINQFTQTHNRSVDIQEENKELKKKLEDKDDFISKLQATKDKLDKWDYKNTLQQKEFINYMNSCIKELGKESTNKLQNTINLGITDITKTILQKYKSIIGVSDEKEN